MDYIKEISFGLSLLGLVCAMLCLVKTKVPKEIKRREDPSLGDYKSINARD